MCIGTITAVVPCYNAAATLGRCLDALRQATPAPAEILVVDDGSSDESAAIAVAHGATLLPQQWRGGPAAARNRGLAAARGSRVLLCDADVVVAPDVLAQALAAWQAVPYAGGVQGVYSRNFGGKSAAGAYKHAQQWANIAALVPGPTPILGSSLALVDRELVLGMGGFTTAIDAASIEDRLLGVKLWAAGRPMILVPEMVGTHLHDYNALALACADFHRARDEVVYASDLGRARTYVAQVARLRYGIWAIGVVSAAVAVVVPPAAWIAAVCAGVTLALDIRTTAHAAGTWRLAWLPIAVLDHTAVVVGAVLGLAQRIWAALRAPRRTQANVAVA